jgi:hypothetical protein
MDNENVDQDIALRSARVYLPLSLGAGALFYLAATLTGDHTLVARMGGAVWVTLLSLIVSMPIVTSRVKKAVRG